MIESRCYCIPTNTIVVPFVIYCVQRIHKQPITASVDDTSLCVTSSSTMAKAPRYQWDMNQGPSSFANSSGVIPQRVGGGKGAHYANHFQKRRKVYRDNIMGLTKPSIRRLARRGGVKRISGLIMEETRSVLRMWLDEVISRAVRYTEHARRQTVTLMDIVLALKHRGGKGSILYI